MLTTNELVKLTMLWTKELVKLTMLWTCSWIYLYSNKGDPLFALALIHMKFDTGVYSKTKNLCSIGDPYSEGGG